MFPSWPGLSPQVGFTRLVVFKFAQLWQARVVMPSRFKGHYALLSGIAGSSPAMTKKELGPRLRGDERR